MKRPDLVTSTDYAHPHRPWPLRAYNRARRQSDLSQLFDPETLMGEASAATGLTDFGDPAFVEPLRVLTESLIREAGMHALGRDIMRGRIVSMLANRLRIEARVAADPSIVARPLRRPIVIAGLQRTGTTVLHRLLAADPRARSLASWEALHPAPMPFDGPTGSSRRRAEAKLAEVSLAAIAPEFFAIHPVEAGAPEEDVLLLDHVFTSQAPEATLHVPTYARWLESHDLVPAYRYMKRILQVLDAQRTGEFWVLKTPHHMEYLDELLTVFPDAVIVATHRDPQATMGSFCSMVAHGRGVFADDVDAREVGRHWLRKVRRMIDRSVAVRDSGHAASFVDVSYYDVLADPMAQVRRIYAHAGRELTTEAESAMRAVLERDTQHRFGRHVYRTRDFGLSPTIIEETFADYRERFAVPRESVERDASTAAVGPSGVGHSDPIRATVTGIFDLFTNTGFLVPIGEDARMDGQTAMVTGSNTGLGKAIAIDFARRGARVLMACRSGIPEAGLDVAAASGSDKVEMLGVDLGDLDSVDALAAELARRGITLDVLVCNAGLVPSKGQRSKQGFEMMFSVHYLANHLLLRRLLTSGVVPNDVYATNGRHGSSIPRVVFVSSEAHRSSKGLDFEHFGAFVDYSVSDGMLHYGNTKLALCTFASELARRMSVEGGPSVAVHALCPGPVDSSIARDAPRWSKPLLAPVMRRFFRSPAKAAEPVVYLSIAPDVAGDTGWYMHLMRQKAASDLATNPENGRRLWVEGEALLAERLARH